jgi:hypothetical protein
LNGLAPPVVVIEIVPLEPPLQLILVMVGLNKIGELQLDPHGVNCTVVVNVEVHEFASVTVTV